MADLEEKLCRLVSKFSRVYMRRLNVYMSKIMRCFMYLSVDRMHARLNVEPLQEVDSFKYMGRKSQVVANGGYEGVYCTA